MLLIPPAVNRIIKQKKKYPQNCAEKQVISFTKDRRKFFVTLTKSKITNWIQKRNNWVKNKLILSRCQKNGIIPPKIWVSMKVKKIRLLSYRSGNINKRVKLKTFSQSSYKKSSKKGVEK